MFFVAWQIGYLKGLSDASVTLQGAERVVGTSAGSVVATLFSAGKAASFFDELHLLAKVPQLVAALAPAGDLHDSQLRAIQTFESATSAEAATVREIGRAALAAHTPSPESMQRNIMLVVRKKHWPSDILHVSTVDTYTGDRCIITGSADVSVSAALAASTAIPGVFAPQQIKDRKCMDGGTSGTGTQLDLLAGSTRALVLSLRNPETKTQSGMTQSPTASKEEMRALQASGTRVFTASPTTFTPEDLMAPTAVGKALTMGREQGQADSERVGKFWSA